MKHILFIGALLSLSSIHAMQRLIHSGDFSVVELSEQELKELKEQRRLTPVPTIKCYYLDIENENGPQRLTIEQATRMVVARHAIAQRPAQD